MPPSHSRAEARVAGPSLLRAGFDRLAEAVLLFDLRGRVAYANPAAAQLLRRESKEILGHALSSWRPVDVLGTPIPRAEWPVRRVLRSGVALRDLIVGSAGEDGAIQWLRINAEPIDEGGQLAGVVMSLCDENESLRSADARRADETITQQLMEALADGVFVAQDERFVFANPALTQMLGHDRDTFIGTPFANVVAPLHYPLWIERYAHRVGSGSEPTRRYETGFIHADGSTVIDLDLMATRTSYRGRPAVLGVVRDIRERKRVDAELERHRFHLQTLVEERTAEARHALQAQRDSQSFVQRVTDSLPVHIAYIDHARRLRFANEAWLRWQGCVRGDAIGRPIEELVSAEILSQAADGITRALQGTSAESFIDMTSCEGVTRTFKISRLPDVRADGSVVGYQTIATDVSVLRENQLRLEAANQALLKAERFSRTIADTLPVRIAYWDRDLRCRFVNRAYRERYEGSAEALIGRSHDEIFDDSMLSERMQHLHTALNGEALDFESEHVDSHGAARRSHVHLTPVSQDGEVYGVLVLGIDVTAQHRDKAALSTLNEQLVVARDRAETAAKAKASFLANMSHEIRTPMNAIIGLTHALRRDTTDVVAGERLARIADAADHLLQIINDVLDLSKIDAGKVVIESTLFEIASMLSRSCGLLAEQAKSKGLELVWSADGVPMRGIGDPTRISQALVNLLGNAVKFTERGRIDVEASVVDSDADGMLLRFEVRDSGMGVEASRMPHLFNAFEQADASTTRRFGGTGLGLALTRHLARLMGGDAGAHSEPGIGSRFWITVRVAHAPVQLRASGEATTTRAPPYATPDRSAEDELRRRHAGALVLVAEDNAVNQEVALSLLEAAGLVVDIAANGEEAIAQARANDYALILMDMQMPVLDGLEASRVIRAEPRHAELPIIAMTANAFAEDRNAALAAGMNDHIAKPVHPPVLYRTLSRWLDWRASRESGAPDEDEAATLSLLHELDGLDTERGVAFFAGRVPPYIAALREFVRLYADGLPASDGTATGLRRELHGSGAACSGVGAVALGALAHAMLAQLRQHDDVRDHAATAACEHEFSVRLRVLSRGIASRLGSAPATAPARRAHAPAQL